MQRQPFTRVRAYHREIGREATAKRFCETHKRASQKRSAAPSIQRAAGRRVDSQDAFRERQLRPHCNGTGAEEREGA